MKNHYLIKRLLLVYFLLICYTVNAESLRNASEGKLNFCVAVNVNQVNNCCSEESQIIKDQFNSIVAENCMKMESLLPKEDSYYWDDADKFVEFGIKNNQKIIGHTLIWHSQAAEWFTKDKNGKSVSPKVMRKRLKSYITTVVSRYKGKVHGWDVVNEAFEDNGSYRKTPIYDILGEEYIKLAFKYAHEADPDAELYYNDYSMANRLKCNAVAKLVKELKKDGCRIDAVGFQGHMDMDFPTTDEMEKSILKIASTDTKVHITEWDVSILPSPYQGAEISMNFNYSEKLDPYKNGVPDDCQKLWNERVMSMFRLFMKHSDTVERVTFWGLSDQSSWKNDFPVPGRTDYALFFDRNLNPKPVISLMVEELAKCK